MPVCSIQAQPARGISSWMARSVGRFIPFSTSKATKPESVRKHHSGQIPCACSCSQCPTPSAVHAVNSSCTASMCVCEPQTLSYPNNQLAQVFFAARQSESLLPHYTSQQDCRALLLLGGRLPALPISMPDHCSASFLWQCSSRNTV